MIIDVNNIDKFYVWISYMSIYESCMDEEEEENQSENEHENEECWNVDVGFH